MILGTKQNRFAALSPVVDRQYIVIRIKDNKSPLVTPITIGPDDHASIGTEAMVAKLIRDNFSRVASEDMSDLVTALLEALQEALHVATVMEVLSS